MCRCNNGLHSPKPDGTLYKNCDKCRAGYRRWLDKLIAADPEAYRAECRRKNHERREYNREYMRKYAREKYAQNREHKKVIARRGYVADPIRTMVATAKFRARRGGVPFDPAIADELRALGMPTHCPVLGIPLRFAESVFDGNSPSLDRVNPSLGYVLGNVRIISDAANRAKRNSTPETLEAIARYMRAHDRAAPPSDEIKAAFFSMHT